MRLKLNSKSEYKADMHVKSLKKDTGKQINFKGSRMISAMRRISQMMDKNKLMTSYSSEFDVKSTMNMIRKRIGTSADVLYEHIKGDAVINTAIQEKDGKLIIRSKKPLRLIIDGIIYPVAKIPFSIFYWTLNKFKKFDAVRNSQWLKDFEKSAFYNISHSYLKKEDKLNALTGLMEIGSQNSGIGSKARAKSFLQNTAKTFDSKFGNYNGVHERALTRIVTGVIPAFFLANDAYNLSILCTNNKNEAKHEKDLRFMQELRRVFSNAYLQLITLGALSKYINKSKSWFVGVTIGTVLFSEIYSRLRTGKKIHFISPEEAKIAHLQEKQQALKEKLNKGLSFVLEESTNPVKVNLNGVEQFKKDNNKTKFRGSASQQNNPVSKLNSDAQSSKSIFTLKGILKYVGGVIAAGLALRFIKKIPLKNGKVGDLFEFLPNKISKFYKKFTMMKNHIQKADMKNIIEKMRNCGFETLAKNYEKVVLDYQRLITMPKFITPEVINAVRKDGGNTIANYLQAFVSGKHNKQMLNGLKNDVIKHNLEVFKVYLKKRGQNNLLNTINQMTAGGKIDYDKLKKVMNAKENEGFKDIFENIFSIDDNTLKLGLLKQVKKVLTKSKNKVSNNLWQSIENKTIDEINKKDFYDLGIKKIPVLKDTLDFCIQPFKFLWEFATLPYRGVNNFLGMLKSKPVKAMNDIDAVSKAMTSLSKKIKMSNKDFTDMFNEKVVKGFNSTTMSKVVNSELSALATSASLLTTISFRISDHYNMVMIKTAGKGEEEADQKGKERLIQEISRYFWQQMFIKLFNNTFSDVYNSSLWGASLINTADTTISEICTRKAVGLPVLASSKEEIIQLEKDNLSGNGIKSKFFRFMSQITGKKPFSERDEKKIKK